MGSFEWPFAASTSQSNFNFREIWLLTGCGSGFGERFIRLILAHGDKAIAAGRDSSHLSALKEAGAALPQLDVAAKPSVLDAKVHEAIWVWGYTDVLINNAGHVSPGTCEDKSPFDLFSFPRGQTG